MFILLSANAAAFVAGYSTENNVFAALQPVALTDGRFILGDEVLTDPAHAEHKAFLSVRPQADLSTVANLLPLPTNGVAL